jgi:RNA polymerase sigma-70 factor, ECF subfamily
MTLELFIHRSCDCLNLIKYLAVQSGPEARDEYFTASLQSLNTIRKAFRPVEKNRRMPICRVVSFDTKDNEEWSTRRATSFGPLMSDLQAMRLTEEQLRSLLFSARKGDSASYGLFLAKLRSHLRAFLCRRLSRADSDVDDILQEVLIAVHKAQHTYRAEQPLTAWAHAIARYKLVDFFRAQSRRAAFDVLLGVESDHSVSAEGEAVSATQDIDHLLDNLPDRYRLPILHIKLHGLSVRETSQLTGLSESAVKIGVHRGIKRLMGTVGAKAVQPSSTHS